MQYCTMCFFPGIPLATGSILLAIYANACYPFFPLCTLFGQYFPLLGFDDHWLDLPHKFGRICLITSILRAFTETQWSRMSCAGRNEMGNVEQTINNELTGLGATEDSFLPVSSVAICKIFAFGLFSEYFGKTGLSGRQCQVAGRKDYPAHTKQGSLLYRLTWVVLVYLLPAKWKNSETLNVIFSKVT